MSSQVQERTAFLNRHAYAHRGLHRPGGPVENSLPAFAAAIAAGHGMECDVQLSRDGCAMVFHDSELDRLTAQTGAVFARSAAELAAIPLRDGDGSTIPSLRELLDLVAGRTPLLIELKVDAGTDWRALCRMVENELADYAGPVAVMSFSGLAMGWFRRHAPDRVRGMVMTDELGWRDRLRHDLDLWWSRPDFLAYDIRFTPSRWTMRQRARGLPVLCWTVRTAQDRARAAAHADGIIFEDVD